MIQYLKDVGTADESCFVPCAYCDEGAVKFISEEESFRTKVIIKLTMLIGACRTPSIKKTQIEESIERFIKEIEA